MSRFDLRAAAPGDRVDHEFLVRDRAEKSTRAGAPFVVLTLGNGSGSIDTAPIWSERLDWCAGADKGRVVFDGEVINTRDKEQLFRLRRRVGMLFQFGSLFTDLTVF